MARPVWIDTSGATARHLGRGRGMTDARVRALRLRARGARDEVAKAAAAGALPHERLRQRLSGGETAVDRVAAALPAGPLAVVGEPSALRAHRVLVAAEPGLRWVDAPLDHDPGLPVVEVPGPAWATAAPVATAALPADTLAGLASAPGAPETETIEDMDGRFGVFSPLSLALLRRSGQDLEPVHALLDELSVACRAPSTDPALGLATWLLACALEDDAPELAIIGGGVRGRAFARWAAGALAAITKGKIEGPLVRSVGLAPRVVRPGDESQLGWLTAPGRVPWLLTVEPGVDGALDPLLASHRALQHEVAGPVIRLRMRNGGPASLAAAAWLVLEAALTVAVQLGLSPLAMDEADRFHGLRSEAQSDSKA